MNRPLFLVGFMGSGKSIAGRRIAGSLGVGFRDCDAMIAQDQGRTVEQIFASDGEPAFRLMESRIVEQLCAGEPLVVATGGGAFLSYRSRRRMIEAGTTVWLDAPWQVIRARLAEGGSRPLWDRDDLVGMRRLYETRRPAYALAGQRVDATDTEAAAGEVVRLTVGR